MTSTLKWVMCPECFLRFQIRLDPPLVQGCCFGCTARDLEIDKLQRRLAGSWEAYGRLSRERSDMGFALDNARVDAEAARARDPRSSYQGG